MDDSTRLRRARSLLVYWDDGELIAHNYLQQNRQHIDGPILDMLNRLQDWQSPEQICRQLPRYKPASIKRSLQRLLDADLLASEDQQNDQALQEAWPYWGHSAQFFQFANRDVPFVQTLDQLYYGERLQTEQAPKPLKRYPKRPRIHLPRNIDPPATPPAFFDTLLQRRTRRAFGPQSLTQTQLSQLLLYCFCPTSVLDAGALGTLVRKTSASGGSRHEAECYVGILNVEGLPNGLYHYCAVDHSLERLRDHFSAEEAAYAASNQEWVGDAACVLFVSAVLKRMAWKYRHDRALRILYMNQGQLGQTFELVCTALRLAPFVTAAIQETHIEDMLGLNGSEEPALYLLACGHAAADEERPAEWPFVWDDIDDALIEDAD